MRILLLLLVLLPLLAQAAPFSGETYLQQLRLRFASAAEAAQAQLTIAPVYDNREWALSARWDDCNANSLVMREHLAKYGLKGTFYLTGTDAQGRFGEQFARELMRDGCSLGGHSMTHPNLTTLAPNQIWQEIMANRVEREAQTDTLINSFAFPYGQHKSADHPQAQQDITEALDRAGYSHCVYQDFVRNNPFLRPEAWTTGCQVVPGDKVVDAAKFQESLDKILRFKDAYQKVSHCIFLGVHAWQQGEEWAKFDAVLQTLTDRNWWVCNQTEWAAYARQVQQTKWSLLPGEAGDPVVACQFARPPGVEVGAMVPLTVVVTGPAPRQVLCDDKPLPMRREGEQTILNLPASEACPLPAQIDQISVTPNAAEAVTPPKFPFLHLRVGLRLQDEAPALNLRWEPTPELTGASVSFRLPLRYQHGCFSGLPVAGPTLAASGSGCPLKEQPDAERYREGPETFVIEFNFRTKSDVGRVYVTFQTDVDAQG